MKRYTKQGSDTTRLYVQPTVNVLETGNVPHRQLLNKGKRFRTYNSVQGIRKATRDNFIIKYPGKSCI